MDTIRNYVDMMFKDFPKTKDVVDIKLNILDTMEDKYNELIADGKSENEAVGTVISQFGNIDELKSEMGIKTESIQEHIAFVSDEDVCTYITFKHRFSYAIAIGVMLCILSFIPTFYKDGPQGILLFFTGIAIAVAIFIIYGMKNSRYEDFEKNRVRITPRMEQDLRKEFDHYKTIFGIAMAVGVGLCIIGVALTAVLGYADSSSYYSFGIPLLDQHINIGFSIDTLSSTVLFLFASAAVGIFIIFGIRYGTYTFFLENEKRYQEITHAEHSDKAFGIIMPIVAILYLILGFCFDLWHPGWLIFPIAAVLTSAYVSIKKHDA